MSDDIFGGGINPSIEGGFDGMAGRAELGPSRKWYPHGCGAHPHHRHDDHDQDGLGDPAFHQAGGPRLRGKRLPMRDARPEISSGWNTGTPSGTRSSGLFDTSASNPSGKTSTSPTWSRTTTTFG